MWVNAELIKFMTSLWKAVFVEMDMVLAQLSDFVIYANWTLFQTDCCLDVYVLMATDGIQSFKDVSW